MGVNSTDATTTLKTEFEQAFSFHSFRLNTIPQFTADRTHTVVKFVSPSPMYHTDYRKWVLIIVTISIFYCLVKFIFCGPGKDGYATLAAALMAVVAASETIRSNRLLKAIELSINTIDRIFYPSDKIDYITKSGAGKYSVSYEQSAKKTIQLVLRKSKSLKDPAEKNLFLTSLALCHKNGFREHTLAAAYPHYDFLQSIDLQHLTTVLNNIEQMCQGMAAHIQDENTVRNYFGAGLTDIINDLLPYIYTRREIHIMRNLETTNSLSLYAAEPDRLGLFYKMKEETHDLLYEYLEYYCYKWYWSREYKPVCFEFFHQRIKTLYHACYTVLSPISKLKKPFSPESVLPYVKIGLAYHEQLTSRSNTPSHQAKSPHL